MSDNLAIESRAVEPFFKNGYLLTCTGTGHTAYIDPGDEAPQLLEYLRERELELVSIVNTHGHMDHICGVKVVKEEWDVPVYIHEEDEFLYNALSRQAEWFGMSYPDAPPIDYYLSSSQQLTLGDLSISIRHTPGHSPGSVSLIVEEHVFCGDLIFAGSVGRTDLPKGSMEVLLKSIQDKILPLGDHYQLHPGHGPSTTVGREKESNPYL